MKQIFFLSSNEYKIAEVQNILNSDYISIIPVTVKINEIQSESIEVIAIDKVIKAFKKTGHPILVEQTGLFLDDLGGFPGGLTQIFWDSIKADDFCKYFGHTDTARVKAKTVLAYCDGKTIHTYEGEIAGIIVKAPRGDKSFQWDCVFQPNGCLETFAEMGAKKNEISMRKKALEAFRKELDCERD